MPPRRLSRYAFCEATVDDAGDLVLGEPEPFRYRVLSDNITHKASDGDTLFHLAGRYFVPLPRAAGLWWIIADFQRDADTDPIIDPTLKLEAGRSIDIPSVRTVTELIFNEQRRAETTG